MKEKYKILVVSGDAVMRSFLEEKLSQSDYYVVSTPDSGDELRSVFDNVLPDFVIVDIMMPSLDGIEVSLRIRQWSKVPIMMLSAWGAGKGKVRGLDLSTDIYLTEPFGAEKLISRIESLLRQNSIVMGHFSPGQPRAVMWRPSLSAWSN